MVIYRKTNKLVFIVKSKRYGDQVVTIDDRDQTKVNEYHWSVTCEKSALNLLIVSRFYVGVKKTRSIRLDQLILGIKKMPRLADIIHRDGDPMNFRRDNLRYIGKKLEDE